jgi:hypothetical protein
MIDAKSFALDAINRFGLSLQLNCKQSQCESGELWATAMDLLANRERTTAQIRTFVRFP